MDVFCSSTKETHLRSDRVKRDGISKKLENGAICCTHKFHSPFHPSSPVIRYTLYAHVHTCTHIHTVVTLKTMKFMLKREDEVVVLHNYVLDSWQKPLPEWGAYRGAASIHTAFPNLVALKSILIGKYKSVHYFALIIVGIWVCGKPTGETLTRHWLWGTATRPATMPRAYRHSMTMRVNLFTL